MRTGRLRPFYNVPDTEREDSEMGATTGSTNAILTWFAEWGQVYYVGIQTLFWITIAVAALTIAFQYKRYVSYKVGDAKPKTESAPDAHIEALVE